MATQVTTGVNPIGPLLTSLLASGDYADMRLLSDAGIEATRNCQTRSALDSAISALAQPADFSEWVEAWSRYMAVAAKRNTAMLPNMAGHFAFMTFTNKRLASKALQAYDISFRLNKNLVSDAGWIRDGSLGIDLELALLVMGPGAAKSGAPSKQAEGQAAQICHNWNLGQKCASNCARRHVCELCQGNHKASKCFKSGSNSSYNHSGRRNRNYSPRTLEN